MITRLIHRTPSRIAEAPPHDTDKGPSPVPFIAGNSDRIILRMYKIGTEGQEAYYFPCMGLRTSGYDVKTNRQKLYSLITHLPAISKEYVLYAKAKQLITSVSLSQQPAPDGAHRSGQAAAHPVRVFLFEIIRSRLELVNPRKNHFQIQNDLDFFKPLKDTPSLQYVHEITHLSFIPGCNDIFMPFLRNEERDTRVDHYKPHWYCGAFRVWDQRDPGTVLVFAYKIPGSGMDAVNGFAPSDTVSLLYEPDPLAPRNTPAFKEPRNINHLLPYVPGRCDLLKPFDDIEPGKVMNINHRVWSAQHPGVIQVFGEQISNAVTHVKVRA